VKERGRGIKVRGGVIAKFEELRQTRGPIGYGKKLIAV
jgi:hypothetical protein